MSGEPILGKREPQPWRDHHPMTWARFLKIRAWAQEVAERTGWPVYLVGSALSKVRPRDIDISIIMPEAEFIRRYGPIPDPESPEMERYLLGPTSDPVRWQSFHALDDALRMRKRVDLKLCPDTWWPEKDRLLLAAPKVRDRP